MASLRPHGQLPDYETQISGPVEGRCVAVDEINSLVWFTVTIYSVDYEYGPSPYIGGKVRLPVVIETADPEGGLLTGYSHDLPPVGSRLLVLFTMEGIPWVLGWTSQP